MKKLVLVILTSIFLFGIGCSKDDSNSSKDNLVGTWIEKYPEKFDGISDTLIFTEDSTVKKYFAFKDCKYSVLNDTISFQKAGKIWRFHFEYITNNEMIIYNFIDRLITQQVKDINCIKIN